MYMHSTYMTVRIRDGCPGWLTGKEPTCQCGRHRRRGFDPWVGKSPWRKKWQPTPAFWPGEFQGQRMGYSPCSCKKLDVTEHARSQRRVYMICIHGLNEEIKSTRHAFARAEGRGLPSPDWIHKYSCNTSLG